MAKKNNGWVERLVKLTVPILCAIAGAGAAWAMSQEARMSVVEATRFNREDALELKAELKKEIVDALDGHIQEMRELFREIKARMDRLER